MFDWARYRGPVGQWGWLAHRLTGAGILVFLLFHVLDTALLGFGPGAYDTVVEWYRHPVVRFLEIALFGAVLYHGFNGLRVILIDFWDKGARLERPLFYGVVVAFVVTFVPVAVVMLSHLF